MEFHEKLHEILRLERKRKNLKQKNLAAIVGISPGFYWRIENGEVTDIRMSVLKGICEALGLEFKAFIGRAGADDHIDNDLVRIF